MRYVIYTRVSDEGQVDNSSLASQERLAREYGDSQGWTHIETIRDQGSRDTLERSNTTRLFNILEQFTNPEHGGKPEQIVVVIYKVDRAGGESVVFSELFGRIYSANCTIAVVDKRRHYETLLDIMAETVFDRAISEHELYTIRKRTAQGTLDHLERKSILFRPPYGYVLRREQRDGISINSAVVDNEPAKIIKLIFQSIVDGDSVQDVCKMLNRRGIPGPTGKAWNSVTVRNIVRELGEKYAGQDWTFTRKINKSKSVSVELSYPAIVPLDLVIAARRELAATSGGDKTTRPFKGLITCSFCGRTAQIRTSGKQWWTSACNSYATHHNYRGRGIPTTKEICPYHISLGVIEKKLREWLRGEGEESLEAAIGRLQSKYKSTLTWREVNERDYERKTQEKREIADKILKLSDKQLGSVLEVLNERLIELEEKLSFTQYQIDTAHKEEARMLTSFRRLGIVPIDSLHRARIQTKVGRANRESFDFHANIGALLDALEHRDPESINRHMVGLGLKISANYSLPKRSERLASITIELDLTGLEGEADKAYEPYDVPPTREK
jgi:DNA invertase Pin-like site-specific DNA recombinase